MTDKIGGIAADALKGYVERWERLQEEKEAIANDQKEVMAEAKAMGFDTKIIREIIKLRKLSAPEREEREALIDIYKAALGMLNDTPLGEAAIRRLTGKSSAPPASHASAPSTAARPYAAPPSFPEEDDGDGNQMPDATDEPAAPEPTIDGARTMGRTAAEAGQPVTANPFPARDPRRAAWDEGWCSGSGGTGMEIPGPWRRAPKKGGDDSSGAGASADDGRSAAA